MNKKIINVSFEIPSSTDMTKFMSYLEGYAHIVGVKVKEEKTVYVSSTLVKVDGEWKKSPRYGNEAEAKAAPRLIKEW